MFIGDKSVDVRQVLEEIGYRIDLESGGWLCGCCPIHQDAHRSFAVHEEQGNWVCYASCGSGSLVSLVAEVEGLTQQEARQRVLALATDVGVDVLLDMLRGDREPAEYKKKEQVLLYERGKAHRYILDRGFTVATLKAFDMGWDPETRAVVVPVFETGRLVALIKRLVAPTDEQQKYDTQPAGFHKGGVLFGLDRVLGEEAIVVEGPLDAIWLHQYGYPGVACLGSALSTEQVTLLRRRVRSVILAFDADEAGEKGRRKAVAALIPYMRVRHLRVPQGPDGKKRDVQDCGPEELKNLVDNVTEAALDGLF